MLVEYRLAKTSCDNQKCKVIYPAISLFRLHMLASFPPLCSVCRTAAISSFIFQANKNNFRHEINLPFYFVATSTFRIRLMVDDSVGTSSDFLPVQVQKYYEISWCFWNCITNNVTFTKF